MKKEGI